MKKNKPKLYKKFIKDASFKFKGFMLPIFAYSGFLSSIYYCFFNFRFYREHKATLKGIIAYHSSISDIKESSALLRRNIHRLEKGLIMKPRREIFANKFINETVDHYILINNQESFCKYEKKWAKDVLTEFFKVVGNTENIDSARELFKTTQKNETTNSLYIPYQQSELLTSTVNYDDLYSLFKKRRSTRWFLDKKVEMSNIKKAVNAAVLAPSACNRQPFQFVVMNTPEKAVDIAKLAMGTAGFCNNIPCLIAIVGNLNAYPLERDRHVIYIDASLASMQLMLALETLGLSSCSINWPDIESREKKIHKKLKLKDSERVVMLMAVGYAEPSGGIPFSQKKTDSLMIREV